MPFICLANTNVPDGVLQITDLWPNVSQHNNPTYPAGQNRYLRRPALDNAAVNVTSGLVVGSAAQSNLQNFEGLGAYLVDKVEPGSLDRATATISIDVLPVALDTIIVNAVIHIEFTGAASDATAAGTVGDPLLVNIKGTAALTADELTVVGTNAGAIVTMRGLNANIYPDISNIGVGVTMLADFTGGGGQLGVTGDMTLALTGAGVAGRITLPTPARLARTNEVWDAATITTATTAVLARMDAGALSMDLAGITAALVGVSADPTGAAASSNSVGTVAEFLSVLAGRSYRLPAATAKFTAATAPDTAHIWSATLRGSFTTPNTTWDTGMLGGEWGATTAGVKALKTGGDFQNPTFAGGGDVVNNEIGEARATFDSTAFQASVLAGQLFRYANGVTLFPDHDVQAHVAQFLSTKQTRQATLLNQRLVTVYDDDGTLLV